ncbi:hypothetical protein HanXRQr2_Chr03g0117541 [Helianthus annuus]|uniref:Uncharacterized protein n=1 Tax=Helianthus annuus TaxID=4232 RepID=A0A9K3NWC6_HELAN|nr:hypothetical protein HanXRQr2_Chr03g0117541 [Helianthus annuus]
MFDQNRNEKMILRLEYLSNFFGTWPNILKVHTLSILCCPNWLLLEVDVNLKYNMQTL